MAAGIAEANKKVGFRPLDWLDNSIHSVPCLFELRKGGLRRIAGVGAFACPRNFMKKGGAGAFACQPWARSSVGRRKRPMPHTFLPETIPHKLWGSQSWLQPAFSRLPPGGKIRVARKSRLKGGWSR
jgi:hypothetical protein